MEMIPTVHVSSQIATVGYDPATRRMRVRFLRGESPYEYEDVSPEEFAAIQTGESPGRAFNQTIRGKKIVKKLEGH